MSAGVPTAELYIAVLLYVHLSLFQDNFILSFAVLSAGFLTCLFFVAEEVPASTSSSRKQYYCAYSTVMQGFSPVGSFHCHSTILFVAGVVLFCGSCISQKADRAGGQLPPGLDGRERARLPALQGAGRDV